MHPLSLAPPQVSPDLAVGCSYNDECPNYSACENRQCINPCAVRNPCAPRATCRVVNHEPVCTCPDGFIGSPQTECRPRKCTFLIACTFAFMTRNRSNILVPCCDFVWMSLKQQANELWNKTNTKCFGLRRPKQWKITTKPEEKKTPDKKNVTRSPSRPTENPSPSNLCVENSSPKHCQK